MKNQKFSEYKEDAVRQAIEFSPNFYFNWCQLGKILQQQDKLEDALNAYSVALDLYPQSSYSLYQIGQILKKQNKLIDALEFYQKAIYYHPNIYGLYQKNLIHFLHKNQLTEAFLYYFYTLNARLDDINREINLAKTRQTLLITGQMRSGTTLLANLLNEQPSIMMYRDFLHIQRLMKSIDLQSLDEILSTNQYSKLVELFIKQTSNLPHQNRLPISTKSLVQPQGIQTLLDFYLCVLGFLSERNEQSKIIGHKSTGAHSIISDMLNFLPNLKVIYILRDPRDVLTSSVEFLGTKGNQIIVSDLIKRWKDAFNTVYVKLSRAVAHLTRLQNRT